MGKRNKGRNDMLPKDERTLNSSKILTRNLREQSQVQAEAAEDIDLVASLYMLTASQASSSEHDNFSQQPDACLQSGVNPSSIVSSTPQRGSNHFDGLNDDVLVRILRLAGFLGIINATCVCRHWRRVARSILEGTRRLDVVSSLRPLRLHLWSQSAVFRTMFAFPSLFTLSLRGWPMTIELSNYPAQILRKFTSATLRELDVSGVDFDAEDLIVFLNRCPALCVLNMSGCRCVGDAMIRNLYRHLSNSSGGGSAGTSGIRVLDRLDVSGCSKVTVRGIQDLVRGTVAKNVFATTTGCHGLLRGRNCHLKELSLASSPNLYFASFMPSADALVSLNLSQCPSLTRIAFIRNEGQSRGLALRKLKLTGAAHLQDIGFVSSPSLVNDGALVENGLPEQDATEMGDVGGLNIGATALHFLPNIEELSLFGARSLRSAFFSNRLGLSSAVVCPMPKLKVLDLNGCLGLESLVLAGYHRLEVVDCSGCVMLDILDVRDVPVLEKLLVQTKRAPLRNIQIEVPLATTVLGKRRTWSWERSGTSHRIWFSGA